MAFILTTDALGSTDILRDSLLTELQAGKRTLWLVPGGSNIPLSVHIMAQLPGHLTTNLTIALTDERYGPLGHPDSNTKQLADAGFDPLQAKVIPVLASNLPLEETCASYAQAIGEAMKNAEVVIGQFGMGADGHIAGMLPGSPAVSSEKLVEGYETDTFVRITLTPPALRQLQAAYVYAFGDNKHEALESLHNRSLSLNEQPAQIIKELPQWYVINDQIGEEA